MTTLVTNKLREHIGEQFIESLSEPANSVYYVAASRCYSFANNDSTIPEPAESNLETEVLPYEEIVFGKKVLPSDVCLMVPKRIWTSNTVYNHYDPEDGDLFTKPFYVAVDGGATYYVYKCLDNNLGTASNTVPSGLTESACNFITTNDGYTWKLMYKMPEATFEKFATSDYMPVVTSANVAGNTISGAIDVIRISNTGSGYISNLSGQFQVDDLREAIPAYSGNTTTYRLAVNASSNTDFYVGSAIYISSGTGSGQLRRITDYQAATRVAVVNTAFAVAPSSDSTYIVAPNIIIYGDGAGAAAYATVSSNSTVNNFISRVNVVNRGSGYTYATAVVAGNTGGLSNTAIVKPVIPPVGGHGHDAPTELGSRYVGLSTTFNTNEGGFVSTENDYRKIILIKDPLFNGVTLTFDTDVGTFSNGERVHQVKYRKLIGTVSGNSTSNNLYGTSTDFANSLVPGDKVIITDTITNASNLRTVVSVTNATAISIDSALSFLTSYSYISFAEITASGIKTGNSAPYITLGNAEPKFVTGKTIIGESSGATANVNTIDVHEKNYNSWNTFDNRTRISYTSNYGSIPEDAIVYQTDMLLSNAVYHSANSTYIFLTNERGPINADPNDLLLTYNSSNTVTLGSNKYSPDLAKGSGKVLYIENNSPISRSPSQSEAIKLILKF